MNKCSWALSSPAMEHYHDHEWGVPVHDDRLLFEYLTLEGAQAGLSWSTILNKRQAYREAFEGFDIETVSRYDEKKIESLLANDGLVRNRLKIRSSISNARCVLEIQNEFGSFDAYLWAFINGTPIQNSWQSPTELPASSPVSDCISADMKKRGFKFFGSTICYAHMQATGMVNDHTVQCFRHQQIRQLAGPKHFT